MVVAEGVIVMVYKAVSCPGVVGNILEARCSGAFREAGEIVAQFFDSVIAAARLHPGVPL